MWIELVYLPQILVFHVKRFNALGHKISKFMEYPAILDMKAYKSKGETAVE